MILRAEVSGKVPVIFKLKNDSDGTIEPLLAGKTVALQGKHYAFALYTPTNNFDEEAMRGERPKSPLIAPVKRLGRILEVRDVPVIVHRKGSESGGKEEKIILARPPVVLVHGLFYSDHVIFVFRYVFHEQIGTV